MGYYTTFVVRIWCNDEEGMLRGQIQHVGTEQHAYFSSLDSMKEFVLSYLSPPSTSTPKSGRIQGMLPLPDKENGDIR